MNAPRDAIVHHDGGTTLTGSAIDIMRAATVRSGLKMHVNTGGRMRLTRTATPAHLMRLAVEITGAKLKPRDYAGAIVALDLWITEARVKVAQIDERTA